MENQTETIIDKLEQSGIPKEELKTNINKLHRTRPYQPNIITSDCFYNFFKEKIYSK